MKLRVTILGIGLAFLQVACGSKSGHKQRADLRQPIRPFSSIATEMPIKFENLSTDYLGDLHFSPDRSVVALPVYIKMPSPADGKELHCKFKVVGRYQLTPQADGDTHFGIQNPQVYFDDRSDALLGNPQSDCLGADPKFVLTRTLIAEYDRTAALKTDKVTLVNDKIVIFGSRQQQPFPWYSNVFVRAGETVDNTDRFFSWYHGSYAEPAGALRIDRYRRLIQVDIAPSRHISRAALRAGVIAREALCTLRFAAPIERVTYNSSSTQAYAGMYIWLKRETISPQQQECLMSRVSMSNKFATRTHIAIGIDVPGRNQIRMSFNDMYWFGVLKAP